MARRQAMRRQPGSACGWIAPRARRAGGTLVLLLAVLAGPVAGVARAQDVATERPPADRWTFTVAPYVWATALDGDAGVGPIDADIDLSFGDILDNLSFAGMLLIDAERDGFGIAVNTVFARLSPDTELGPLDLDVTSDTLHVGVAPYYRLVDWTYGHGASGKPLRLRLEPAAGIRFTHLRLEMEVRGGQTVDQSESWVDPIIGTRFALDLGERWTLSGEADIGGFGVGSDLAWNAQAFLGYETSLFGRPATLAAGYRALSQDYESGSFKWDVTMHGPVLGLALRF